MKKIILTAISLCLIGNLVSAQNLDEVLKSYFDANGQENLLKINNMSLYGKLVQGGLEIPFIQRIARPASFRMEATLQGLTLVQTYNGKEGWTINPFAGVTDPQPFTEDELKNTKYQADLDGMLWNWKEKGYTVTLEGEDEVEGTKCFKVKIETKEGDVFTQYIDADSYMQIRSHSKIKVQDNETEADTFYSNYMQVGGMAIPGKISTLVGGQVVNTIVTDSVQIDAKLDPAIFEKPVNK